MSSSNSVVTFILYSSVYTFITDLVSVHKQMSDILIVCSIPPAYNLVFMYFINHNGVIQSSSSGRRPALALTCHTLARKVDSKNMICTPLAILQHGLRCKFLLMLTAQLNQDKRDYYLFFLISFNTIIISYLMVAFKKD